MNQARAYLGNPKKGDNESRPGQVSHSGQPRSSPPAPGRVQPVRDPADRRRPSGSWREGTRGARRETEEELLLVAGTRTGSCGLKVVGRGRQHGDVDAGEKGTGRGSRGALWACSCHHSRRPERRIADTWAPSPDSRTSVPPTSGDAPPGFGWIFLLAVCLSPRQWITDARFRP